MSGTRKSLQALSLYATVRSIIMIVSTRNTRSHPLRDSIRWS